MPFQGQYRADESAEEPQDAAALEELPFTGYANRAPPDQVLPNDPDQLVDLILYYNSLTEIVDTDYYKLPFSGAGSRQISVLPDLMLIAYAPEIVETLNAIPGNAYVAGTKYISPETFLLEAAVYREYRVDGVSQFQFVTSLTRKTDDIALALGEPFPGGGASLVSFFDTTVNFQANSTSVSGGQTVEALDYYLVVRSNPFAAAFNGTISDSFSTEAGRYLITTGNPTGQRDQAWGGGWVNYYFNSVPPPPLTPPLLQNGAPASTLEGADARAEQALADADSLYAQRTLELGDIYTRLNELNGKLDGLLDQQIGGYGAEVGLELEMFGAWAELVLTNVSPVARIAVVLNEIKDYMSVYKAATDIGSGLKQFLNGEASTPGDPFGLKTASKVMSGFADILTAAQQYQGGLAQYYAGVKAFEKSVNFISNTDTWIADTRQASREVIQIQQQMLALQNRADALEALRGGATNFTLESDGDSLRAKAETAEIVLILKRAGQHVVDFGTDLFSPIEGGPSPAPPLAAVVYFLMDDEQRLTIESGRVLVEGGMSANDFVVIKGAYDDFEVTRGPDYAVIRGNGIDVVLHEVRTVMFDDFAFAAEITGVAAANVLNAQKAILRTAGSTSEVWGDARFYEVAGASAYFANLAEAADETTSVATLSYQFFTGATPTSGGLDYLVSPTGPNTNNINSAYYQAFNLENRYINFAVNLGKLGEGAAWFQTNYGALTLAQAMTKAYAEIFGGPPEAGKVDLLLNGMVGPNMTRAQYFASYGGDGVTGIGTKAAMVGWLLAEAVKANLGIYALANAAYLTDLGDGGDFRVDIVERYGRAEYVFPVVTPTDTAAPTLTSSNPADDATGVSVGADIMLTFNEAVKAGAGAIEVRRVSDNGLASSLSVADAGQVGIAGATVTLNPGADLAASTGYYLLIASGALQDLAGNPFAGFSNASTLNFTTAEPADTLAPQLASSIPADNATGVAAGANILLNFNEAVKAGTGAIEIRRTSDGGLVQSLSVSNTSQVMFSGSTVTLNPPADLSVDTGYYVTMGSGVIRDLANNAFAGISSSTTLNFTTAAPADTTAPAILSTNPPDNGQWTSGSLSITFNEAVKAGTGTIQIFYANGTPSVASQIDSPTVVFSGATVTFNALLLSNNSYYVLLSPGAVTDLAGNAFAGITSPTTFNFTISQPTFPPDALEDAAPLVGLGLLDAGWA